MRDFFVDVMGPIDLATLVILMDGTLRQKLRWLLAGETRAEYIYDAIEMADDAELGPAAADPVIMERLIKRVVKWKLSFGQASHILKMLRGGLLKSEEVRSSTPFQKYEKASLYGVRMPWCELKNYEANAAYEIQYTRKALRIIVRIKLTGFQVSQHRKNIWLRGIHNRWNNKFYLQGSRRINIQFVPIFTDENPHHTVFIKAGRPGFRDAASVGSWWQYTTGDMVAHEFMHMLGLEDEYNRALRDYVRLVGKQPTNPPGPCGYWHTGLGSGLGDVEARHLGSFVAWLNLHLRPGEQPYRLLPVVKTK
jgi:hypothetical protein